MRECEIVKYCVRKVNLGPCAGAVHRRVDIRPASVAALATPAEGGRRQQKGQQQRRRGAVPLTHQ